MSNPVASFAQTQSSSGNMPASMRPSGNQPHRSSAGEPQAANNSMSPANRMQMLQSILNMLLMIMEMIGEGQNDNENGRDSGCEGGDRSLDGRTRNMARNLLNALEGQGQNGSGQSGSSGGNGGQHGNGMGQNERSALTNALRKFLGDGDEGQHGVQRAQNSQMMGTVLNILEAVVQSMRQNSN